MLLATFSHLASLSDSVNDILQKPGYVRTTRDEFPKFERKVHLLLIRSLHCLSLFAGICAYNFIFNNLAESARQITAFAALVVVSGPVAGVIGSFFAFEWVYATVEQALRNAAWSPDAVTNDFRDRFRRSYVKLVQDSWSLVALSLISLAIALYSIIFL